MKPGRKKTVMKKLVTAAVPAAVISAGAAAVPINTESKPQPKPTTQAASHPAAPAEPPAPKLPPGVITFGLRH